MKGKQAHFVMQHPNKVRRSAIKVEQFRKRREYALYQALQRLAKQRKPEDLGPHHCVSTVLVSASYLPSRYQGFLILFLLLSAWGVPALEQQPRASLEVADKPSTGSGEPEYLRKITETELDAIFTPNMQQAYISILWHQYQRVFTTNLTYLVADSMERLQLAPEAVPVKYTTVEYLAPLVKDAVKNFSAVQIRKVIREVYPKDGLGSVQIADIYSDYFCNKALISKAPSYRVIKALARKDMAVMVASIIIPKIQAELLAGIAAHEEAVYHLKIRITLVMIGVGLISWIVTKQFWHKLVAGSELKAELQALQEKLRTGIVIELEKKYSDNLSILEYLEQLLQQIKLQKRHPRLIKITHIVQTVERCLIELQQDIFVAEREQSARYNTELASRAARDNQELQQEVQRFMVQAWQKRQSYLETFLSRVHFCMEQIRYLDGEVTFLKTLLQAEQLACAFSKLEQVPMVRCEDITQYIFANPEAIAKYQAQTIEFERITQAIAQIAIPQFPQDCEMEELERYYQTGSELYGTLQSLLRQQTSVFAQQTQLKDSIKQEHASQYAACCELWQHLQEVIHKAILTVVEPATAAAIMQQYPMVTKALKKEYVAQAVVVYRLAQRVSKAQRAVQEFVASVVPQLEENQVLFVFHNLAQCSQLVSDYKALIAKLGAAAGRHEELLTKVQVAQEEAIATKKPQYLEEYMARYNLKGQYEQKCATYQQAFDALLSVGRTEQELASFKSVLATVTRACTLQTFCPPELLDKCIAFQDMPAYIAELHQELTSLEADFSRLATLLQAAQAPQAVYECTQGLSSLSELSKIVDDEGKQVFCLVAFVTELRYFVGLQTAVQGFFSSEMADFSWVTSTFARVFQVITKQRDLPAFYPQLLAILEAIDGAASVFNETHSNFSFFVTLARNLLKRQVIFAVPSRTPLSFFAQPRELLGNSQLQALMQLETVCNTVLALQDIVTKPRWSKLLGAAEYASIYASLGFLLGQIWQQVEPKEGLIEHLFQESKELLQHCAQLQENLAYSVDPAKLIQLVHEVQIAKYTIILSM